MTALALQTNCPAPAEAPTALLRPGALLHRARIAAAAVWSLAPGRYLAVSDGEEVVVLRLGRVTRIGRRPSADIVLDDLPAAACARLR